MHHVGFESGNHCNFNKDFSGELEFGSPPNMADVLELVQHCMSVDVMSLAEQCIFNEAAHLSTIAMHLNGWSAARFGRRESVSDLNLLEFPPALDYRIRSSLRAAGVATVDQLQAIVDADRSIHAAIGAQSMAAVVAALERHHGEANEPRQQAHNP